MPGQQDPKGLKAVSTPRPVAAPAGTPAQGGFPIIGGGTVPKWYRWQVTHNDGSVTIYEGPTPPDPSTGQADGAQVRGTDTDTEAEKDWQKGQGAQGEGKIVTGPDGRKYRVTGDTMVPLEGQGAGVDPNAPKPGTLPAQQNAQTAQTRAETGQQQADTAAQRAQADQDYKEAMALARQKQLNQAELTAAATAKHNQLQTMVSLGQLEQKEADQRMDRWKAGVEAGQAERRLAIEQQNANTSAGQLGVSRGSLGVSQQNADTQREQVIQSASSNAVDQTLKLLGQYTKVGPGFGSQFAAGLNTLSRGGGAINFTPDAFMNPYVPDLDAIRHSAVSEAIDRLKGGTGMAPATAAAVNATAVPSAAPPAAVPAQPAQQPGTFTPAAIGAAGQAAGILPGAPPAPPPVLPPYTGPVGQGGPGAPPQF